MKHTFSALIVLAVTVCPDQTWRDPAKCPFQIDMSQVVIDPASNQKGLLGWGVAEVGTVAIFDANACDPDGDLVNLIVSDPNRHDLVVNYATGQYSIRTLTQAGRDYIHVTATDVNDFPRTRMGTFVLLGVQANKPPTLGCGSLRR